MSASPGTRAPRTPTPCVESPPFLWPCAQEAPWATPHRHSALRLCPPFRDPGVPACTPKSTLRAMQASLQCTSGENRPVREPSRRAVKGQHGWNLGQQAGCPRVGASCHAGLSAGQKMEGGHESLSTAPSPQMLGADLGHVCTHVYTCGCAHGGMDLCVHAYE